MNDVPEAMNIAPEATNDAPEATNDAPEAWMRGVVAGVDPVVAHLLRAAEQIRDDASAALGDLTSAQIWHKPHGMTSAGFHAKHLAGSTERLATYLTGQPLSAEQLTAIAAEGSGNEGAQELLALIGAALNRYEALVRALQPADFGEVKEIGRKRYQTTAISLSIHIVEHAQRHIGGMIAAAKLARVLWS